MCTRTTYKDVPKTRTVQVDDFEDKPVYKTRYLYTVWRWKQVDEATAKGTDLNPVWPQISTSPNRREGQRKSTYHVYIHEVSEQKV